jgi:hypothetical protein
MVRHAAASVAGRTGFTSGDIQSRIEGYGGGVDSRAKSRDQVQFLPLPSVNTVGVKCIRRFLVLGPPGSDRATLPRRLDGEKRIDQQSRRAVAILSAIPATGKVLGSFLGPATR